jgi:hypothetical protein
VEVRSLKVSSAGVLFRSFRSMCPNVSFEMNNSCWTVSTSTELERIEHVQYCPVKTLRDFPHVIRLRC